MGKGSLCEKVVEGSHTVSSVAMIAAIDEGGWTIEEGDSIRFLFARCKSSEFFVDSEPSARPG